MASPVFVSMRLGGIGICSVHRISYVAVGSSAGALTASASTNGM